jgi:hypothetical protein
MTRRPSVTWKTSTRTGRLTRRVNEKRRPRPDRRAATLRNDWVTAAQLSRVCGTAAELSQSTRGTTGLPWAQAPVSSPGRRVATPRTATATAAKGRARVTPTLSLGRATAKRRSRFVNTG